MPIYTSRTIPFLHVDFIKKLQHVSMLLYTDDNNNPPAMTPELKAILMFGGFVWGHELFRDLLKEAKRTFQRPKPEDFDEVQTERLLKGEQAAVYHQMAMELLWRMVADLNLAGETELASLLAVVSWDAVSLDAWVSRDALGAEL